MIVSRVIFGNDVFGFERQKIENEWISIFCFLVFGRTRSYILLLHKTTMIQTMIKNIKTAIFRG